MPFAFSKIETKFLFLGDRGGGWEFGKGWDSLHWAEPHILLPISKSSSFGSIFFNPLPISPSQRGVGWI